MFEIGDYVVHNGHGLCTILEVHMEDENSFYKLETYHNKMLIKMPLEKANAFLRPMLNKSMIQKALNDALLLSNQYTKDNKERKILFQQLIVSNDIMDTLHLLKMLYHIADDKRLEKKTLGSFDSQFLQMAERKLNNEVAVALEITKDEANSLISDCLKAELVY